MNREYEAFVSRAKVRHGGALDLSGIAEAFIPYFHGPRIKVRRTYESGEVHERTGTVSATSGWKPALMLMHRSSDNGSWDLLRDQDEIVAVQRGRRYIEITNA